MLSIQEMAFLLRSFQEGSLCSVLKIKKHLVLESIAQPDRVLEPKCLSLVVAPATLSGHGQT